jgi:hypothetical protein
METITVQNINDYVVNGVWSIDGSMKPDKESDQTEAKRFTLKVRYNNVSIADVVNKSLEPTKISWVNGVGRKNVDKYKNGEIIEIDFKSPARQPTIDPEVAVATKAKSMGREDRIEYLAGLAGMTVDEFKRSMR